MHKENSSSFPENFFPIILAGGSGTRFWPRSRKTRAKQVLALDGDHTMIQKTFARLMPTAPADRIWVIANDGVAGAVRSQLPALTPSQLICEPCARNTAAACGLMAFIIALQHPEAVLGVFPSDHVVSDVDRFSEVLRAGVATARTHGNIVVLGAPAVTPETGYGYIERSPDMLATNDPYVSAYRVSRFTEKPDYETACSFVQSERYAWNSGMFLWSAKTLCDALHEHAPRQAELLQQIAAAHGSPDFETVFEELYPLCQNISIDYAILEPRSAKGPDANIFCLPADFGWNDLGSWSALYQHHRSMSGFIKGANVVESTASVTIEAHTNYVYAPGRHVALLGVENLVVVVTDDAVLVTRQERSQDVGQIVKQLALGGHFQMT